MEKKRRGRKPKVKSMSLVEKVEKLEKVEEKPVVVEIPKISYSVWFHQKLQKKQVRFWHEEPLEVFMEKNGLKNEACEEDYNRILERF